MSPRSPLDGIDLVLIDGNNLLHRRQGGVGDAALRGLLPALRRQLPPSIRVQFILDGHPEPGAPARERVGSVEIRHAAGTADDAIIAEINAIPWASRARTIVVTDDRALADRSRTAGALPRRLDWLDALPAAGTSKREPTLGSGRPPTHGRRR